MQSEKIAKEAADEIEAEYDLNNGAREPQEPFIAGIIHQAITSATAELTKEVEMHKERVNIWAASAGRFSGECAVQKEQIAALHQKLSSLGAMNEGLLGTIRTARLKFIAEFEKNGDSAGLRTMVAFLDKALSSPTGKDFELSAEEKHHLDGIVEWEKRSSNSPKKL